MLLSDPTKLVRNQISGTFQLKEADPGSFLVNTEGGVEHILYIDT